MFQHKGELVAMIGLVKGFWEILAKFIPVEKVNPCFELVK